MGHAKEALSNFSTHLGIASQSVQSTIVAHAFTITSHASLGGTSILHLALTFLFMWNLHNKLQASGKTTSMAFIRAKSLSLKITVGYTSRLKNNPFNLYKAQMKLFWHSIAIKTNAAEKVKPVDCTLTTSSSGSLYLFVL